MDNNRLDVEQQVLGYLIVHPEYITLAQSKMLEPKQFSTDLHKRLFRMLLDLKEEFTWQRAQEKYSKEELARLDYNYIAELEDVAPYSHQKFLSLLHTLYDMITNSVILSLSSLYKAKLEKEGLEAANNLFNDYVAKIQDRVYDIKKSNLHDSFINKYLDESVKLYTGYPKLDAKLKGFDPKEVVVLAARPGMGKTSFALNLLVRFMQQGRKCALISLEMSDVSIEDRLLGIISNIPIDNFGPLIRSCKGIPLDKIENEDARILLTNHKKLTLKDFPGSMADRISIYNTLDIDMLEHLIKKNNFQVVIIDYIGLIKVSNSEIKKDDFNRNGYVSDRLKQIASATDCIIVAISQLNRAVESREDKRPNASDLRGSGHIEQNADRILMIYRPDYYDKDHKDTGEAIVDIVKNRYGAQENITFEFKKETQEFIETED